MTKRNERLNSNTLAVFPGIEEINIIYKRELLSYESKFMGRIDVFSTIGLFLLLIVLEGTGRYPMFIATLIFGMVFLYKRIKKSSTELLNDFKKGNFSNAPYLYENRSFGVFHLFMIVGSALILCLFISFLLGTATVNLSAVLFFSAAICFVMAFFIKRIQKRSRELLEDIQKGDFKVIHTTVSKLGSMSDELGYIRCNLAGVSDTWEVYCCDVKVGSPVIIAFNDKNWRTVYTEYTLSEKGMEDAVREGRFH